MCLHAGSHLALLSQIEARCQQRPQVSAFTQDVFIVTPLNSTESLHNSGQELISQMCDWTVQIHKHVFVEK